MMNSMNREQTDDLKAFEHRLIECVASIRHRTRVWRYMLVGVILWVVVSVVLWWRDSAEYETYWDMMMAYKSLSASLMTFLLLYIFGIFDRNNAPQVITSRCRSVLQEYNMSCDEQGKLILKKKPDYVWYSKTS